MYIIITSFLLPLPRHITYHHDTSFTLLRSRSAKIRPLIRTITVVRRVVITMLLPATNWQAAVCPLTMPSAREEYQFMPRGRAADHVYWLVFARRKRFVTEHYFGYIWCRLFHFAPAAFAPVCRSSSLVVCRAIPRTTKFH